MDIFQNESALNILMFFLSLLFGWITIYALVIIIPNKEKAKFKEKDFDEFINNPLILDLNKTPDEDFLNMHGYTKNGNSIKKL